MFVLEACLGVSVCESYFLRQDLAMCDHAWFLVRFLWGKGGCSCELSQTELENGKQLLLPTLAASTFLYAFR